MQCFFYMVLKNTLFLQLWLEILLKWFKMMEVSISNSKMRLYIQIIPMQGCRPNIQLLMHSPNHWFQLHIKSVQWEKYKLLPQLATFFLEVKIKTLPICLLLSGFTVVTYLTLMSKRIRILDKVTEIDRSNTFYYSIILTPENSSLVKWDLNGHFGWFLLTQYNKSIMKNTQ